MRHTPVFSFPLPSGRKVWVKREDLVTEPPAPPFSKVRGLLEYMTQQYQKGIRVFGYVESSISMAGWGVAWVAKEIGAKAIIYDPMYKKELETLTLHRKQWESLGALSIGIPAGMVKVNYNICKKKFFQAYPDSSEMLELGLPLKNTIEQTTKELQYTMKNMEQVPDNIVVCVGSGTICAGLLRGAGDCKVIGVTSRLCDLDQKRKVIQKKAGILGGLFQGPDFLLVNGGYEYTEPSAVKCPFPSHPYYDLKAWEWLVNNEKTLRGSILFWNIGRSVYEL